MEVKETLEKRKTVAQLHDEWQKWDKEMEASMSNDDDYEDAKAKRIGALAQIQCMKAWHVEKQYEMLKHVQVSLDMLLTFYDEKLDGGDPVYLRTKQLYAEVSNLIATIEKEV